jgi:hypothetical protein
MWWQVSVSKVPKTQEQAFEPALALDLCDVSLASIRFLKCSQNVAAYPKIGQILSFAMKCPHCQN